MFARFQKQLSLVVLRKDPLNSLFNLAKTFAMPPKAKSTKTEKSSKRAAETDLTKDKQSKRSKKDEETPTSSQDDVDDAEDVTTRNGKDFNFKIASWNINGLRAWMKSDPKEFITSEDPDIFCVQETKCPDKDIPKDAKFSGYQTYWSSAEKKGYSGVGLYSKKKPIKVSYGIGIKEHDTEGRVITAEYDDFHLVTAYVPNSGRGLPRLEYRQKWNKDFLSYLKRLDDTKHVILCGDLNVAHKEIDLANPKSNKRTAGFTQEERDDFTELLSNGFKDSFREFYPDKTGAYSFWTYLGNARARNVGWRLDYFVVSNRLMGKVCDSTIKSRFKGSDHCPLTLLLAL